MNNVCSFHVLERLQNTPIWCLITFIAMELFKCEFRGTKKQILGHNIKIHENREYLCKGCEFVGKPKAKLVHHRQKIHVMIEIIWKHCA